VQEEMFTVVHNRKKSKEMLFLFSDSLLFASPQSSQYQFKRFFILDSLVSLAEGPPIGRKTYFHLVYRNEETFAVGTRDTAIRDSWMTEIRRIQASNAEIETRRLSRAAAEAPTRQKRRSWDESVSRSSPKLRSHNRQSKGFTAKLDPLDPFEIPSSPGRNRSTSDATPVLMPTRSSLVFSAPPTFPPEPQPSQSSQPSQLSQPSISLSKSAPPLPAPLTKHISLQPVRRHVPKSKELPSASSLKAEMPERVVRPRAHTISHAPRQDAVIQELSSKLASRPLKVP